MKTKLCIFTTYREGEHFELEPGKIYSLGRFPYNDIVIKDTNLSRHHLKIQVKSDKLLLVDLKSKNGTFINGCDIPPGIQTEV